ncbi:MAG: tRNA pseudouridine(55) synthase TruB [Clostridiales bacterium]|nr:tRNA pseudouridine(55) synthase TruB [Clostridiales bacterium]
MTGFICLDKQQDISSFWAVRQTLKLLGEKKGGHTGTLDPFATGVLPIAVGRATRFIELLPTDIKAYEAEIRLGITTDTLDKTGEILSKSPVNVSSSDIEKSLESFRGEIKQIPPMYSAIRKDGVRLYDLARRGETVEREERCVTVYRLDFLGFENDTVKIYVECSAGTYIRSIADDLGSVLGCGAVLTALRRTRANGFSIENSVTLEKMREMKSDELKSLVIPLDTALGKYEKITVSEGQTIRFKNGGELLRNRLDCPFKTGLYRVYSPADVFLGIGEIKENSEVLGVRRVVADE